MKKLLSLILSVLMILSLGTTVSAEEINQFTLTVPYADENDDGTNDFSAEFGTLSNYFVYDYITKQSNEVSGDTEILTYGVESDKTYFYRISNDYDADIVTYGAYVTIDENTTSKEVSLFDLCSGGYPDKDTVIDDFSENDYDTGDIYLNINKEGHLSLNSGDEYTIYPLRNWLPIENSNNSRVIEPDFSYSIINLEGTDVLSIEEDNTDTPSKHSLKLSAESQGTALVLVTYDAVTNADAMGGTFFSAIRKENTGVFVVTVDETSGIETNFNINEGRNTIDKKLAGDSLDYEHDVLYYADDAGASFTFTPEEGTTVAVLSPDMSGDNVSYGTAFNEVTDVDGTFTLNNLYEGSHIVKLENSGRVSYQVLRAKKVSYQVLKDGEEVSFVSPGDEISIAFNTVYHPANKMSGVYNFTAAISYETPDGTEVASTPAQYSFATDSLAQTVTFTIPENFAEDSFTLTKGAVSTDFYGSAVGAHRYITYETGKSADFNAIQVKTYLCSLPDITLDVKKTVSVSAYDYTAGGGIILEDFPVTMPNSASATECIKKAFQENNIEITISSSYSDYVSSINGRGEGQGYAGWCFSYNNDDYSNYGITAITAKHGDNLRFDYSMNVDTTTDDIGNGWYGNPVVTEFSLGNTSLKMKKTVSFNEDYSLNISYVYDGTENAVSGSGTKEDPYILNVTSSYSVNLSNATFKTSLNEHYLKFGSEDTGNSNTILMYISSLGEKYKSWYKINVTVTSSGFGGNSTPTKEPEEEPKKDPEKETKTFSDVDDGAWYKESVDFVTSKGIMNGVSEEEFAPQNSMTRGMLVTVLHRLAGEPDAKETTFSDIKSGTYYESAVAWAEEFGIAGGVSDTEFLPNANITREQIAVMIYRFVKHKNASLGETEALHMGYKDSDDISVWAFEAVSYCKKTKIMTGDDVGKFNPKAQATRAEVAKILTVLSNVLTEKES